VIGRLAAETPSLLLPILRAADDNQPPFLQGCKTRPMYERLPFGDPLFGSADGGLKPSKTEKAGTVG
jgi:hypothetical protein